VAQTYTLHPDNPQQRIIDQICDELRAGAVMLYPTDTVYAIGCDLNSKSAVQRVRQLKQLSNDKPLTFLCPSLSNISQYAYVDNDAYRLMKHLIPGPYTFILPATKLVPKLVQNPKRKTTGIRVPDHPVCEALLTTLGHPLISTSASLSAGQHVAFGEGLGPTSPAALFDAFDALVDIAIDSGEALSTEVSTILDLCLSEPQVLRKGLGWDLIESYGLRSTTLVG
jgi:tRNA threonylcarbamoyl adenosine modification protein (Sua5/YciO/YrdC/YwlC family)